MTILHKAEVLISKQGKTPFGKAVEHTVVTAVAGAVALLLKDAATGSLSLTDVSAALTIAGTGVLTGLRAAVKALGANTPKAPTPTPVSTPAAS